MANDESNSFVNNPNSLLDLFNLHKATADKDATPARVTTEDSLSKISFVYSTDHLAGFRELDNAIGLIGGEYTIIKKAIWYTLFSIPIRKTPLKLGRIITDGRFNLAIPLPSGAGKRNLINVIERIANRLNLSVVKPTSFHPEQLVGKTIRRQNRSGNPTFEQIHGHLADDVVIFNEAYELIAHTELAYQEARKYLRTALDPFGFNEVSKRMVDIPRNQRLSYCPSCVILLFFQPFQFGQDVVLTGFLRRFFVIYVKIQEIDPSVYEQLITEDATTDAEIEAFGFAINSSLMSLRNGDTFSLDEVARQRFIKLFREIVRWGLTHSTKGANFTKTVRIYLGELLLKMSCIQALSRCDTNVGVRDVELAFMDLVEFYHSMLDFINEKILGNLNYKKVLSLREKQDMECLSWLHDQDATSFDNSHVSIRMFKQKIQEICRLEEGAENRYTSFKDKGCIDSMQDGQHDSRVWITINARDFQDIEGTKGISELTKTVNFVDSEYWKIANSYKDPHNP